MRVYPLYDHHVVDAGNVGEALAVIRQELDKIAAMPGSEAKVRAIRDLLGRLEELYNTAADIRTAEMFRIYDEEKLSLAPLADRVGMSKARAHQKIQQRKKENPDA